MAKVCAWCGKKLSFMDVGVGIVKIDGQGYVICGDCNRKVSAFRNGELMLKDIVQLSTDKKLIQYIENQEREKVQGEEQERQIKQAQKVDPLYADIHQIAEDLRVIKNFIIISFIVSILVGLIGIFQIL